MNINKWSIFCVNSLIKYKVLLTNRKRNIIILKANIALSLWTSSKGNVSIEKPLTLTPTILDMADNFFETGRYEECYNFLINSKDLDNIEVKWRICRALYNMAKEDKYNKVYKKELIYKAHELIASELQNHWDHYFVQKWYALTLDAKSSCEGKKQKLEQLNTVKKHMHLAVNLNPNDASLLHMLGEICYQVSEIPWHQRVTIEVLYSKLPDYSYDDALEYYLKAEAVQPRFYSVNLLRLGCCYLKINKTDQAKYYLKLAASYPAKSNNDHQARMEAADLLKRLK